MPPLKSHSDDRCLSVEVIRLGQVLWDFQRLGDIVQPADLLIGFGSNDLSICNLAAELYLNAFGKFIVFTGGIDHQGDDLATGWDKSEAEVFRDKAVALGVPEERVFIETQASNTKENFLFSKKLIEARALPHQSVIIVQKPWMERRVRATSDVHWPELSFKIASLDCSFKHYLLMHPDPLTLIDIIAGDFQRLIIYGDKGDSAPQHIPEIIMAAFEKLKILGFDNHLIRQAA